MENEKWSLFGPRPWLSFILLIGIVLVVDLFMAIALPLFLREPIDWNYFWKNFFYDLLVSAFSALSFYGCRYLAYKTAVFKKMTDRDVLLRIMVAIMFVVSLIVGAIVYDWLLALLGF